MKKNIISALFCALAIAGVAACNKPAENFEQKEKTHTVTFMAKAPSADETKTAIMLKMVPDWRNTDVNDVHIFETETASSGNAYFMEASKVEMTTPVDGTWEKAYFYAEFDNATVIVNPPSALTKAGSTFAYTALMATRENDKYLVPAVQYPHVESLIDPKADFLIGTCPNTYSSSRHEQRVNLDFSRPVALSRLAVTNLAGSYVESVKITCVENTKQYNGIITGEVGYADVDFEANTADFQANADSYELTLSYPDGLKRSATTYVYMVTVPGTKSIKSVEVVTDKYIYTKSFATPASLTFYASEFINIAMDMTVGGNVTRVDREPLEMEFDDVYGQPVTEFEYDIYTNSASDFGSVAPTLYIADFESAGTITHSSSNTDVATVDESGNVTLTGIAGETTITATASGDGHQYMASSASYKLTVTNSAPEVTYYKASAIDAGYDYLIVSAANALRLSSGSLSEVAVTVDTEAGTVSLEPVDGLLWTAAAIDASLADYGTHSFSQGSYNLTRLSDSGSYQLVASSDDLTKYMVWNYDGTNFWNTSIYESTVTDFYAYYSEGWRIASSGYDATALYTTRLPQAPAFENATVAFDIYNDATNPFTGQAVADAKTTVTYSIDNAAVATIDPATGAVEVIGKGIAVITATAAASDNWQGATASYTLTVTDSTPSVGGTRYVKVTSVSDLEVDGQYLLVFEGLAGDTDGDGDPKVFDPVLKPGDDTQFYKDASAALDVTISNGIIEDDFEDCQFTLVDGYYLKANKADKFIVPTGSSSGSGTITAESSATTALSIALSDGIVQIKATSGTNYLVWSTSSHYFSSNASLSGQYSTGICLYMLDDGRQSQSISFSAAEAAYDVYAGAWEDGKAVPTLSGAQTTVTYTSSNEAVAEVDPATGEVTIVSGVKKGDKAVITATAVKDETYRAATASYTINITSSDPSMTVYTKVLSNDDIDADGQYILVYETASAAFKPILASAGSYFTKNATNVVDVDIVNNTISSNDLDDCQITFEDGKYLWIESAGKYLYPGASGDSALGAEDKTDSHTVSISIASSGIATIARTSDAAYHLYWSSSNYFSGISQSGSNYAANICLYKLDDGRTPQSLSFSGSSAKFDKATSTWTEEVPTLSGAQTNVTFTSSDESVATVTKVDNTKVTVTIAAGAKKNASAVITATAEGDATYKKAKAHFTVVVDDSSVTTPEYVLVESDSDIEVDGKYLLVNESNSKVFKPVLNGSNFTSAAANALNATIENHTIVSDEFGDCELTLEDGYYFFVESADRYLYPTNSNIGAEETKSSSHNFSISIASDGVATIARTSGSTYRLRWTSQGYFQSSTSSANCQLYKLQENGPKNRGLKFNPDAVSVNINGKTTPIALSELTTVPTLNGKGLADVTYSIEPSTSDVAEVAANGAVTVKNTGTVTIKASAPLTSDYKAGEASYTLTVTNVEATTYTKTTSVSTSGSYLIVSAEDDKLFNGVITTGSNAVNVTPVSGVITDTDNAYSAYEFTFEQDGDNYYIVFDGKYLVCNYTSGDTGTGLLYVSSKSDVKYPYTVSASNGAVFFNTTQANSSTSTNQYLYYKSSNSGSGGLSFKIGQSGSSVGVHIYKKD